jgi:hypothetical protein
MDQPGPDLALDDRRWHAPRCGHRLLQFDRDGYPLPCAFPDCGWAGKLEMLAVPLRPKMMPALWTADAVVTPMEMSVERYRRVGGPASPRAHLYVWVLIG